MASEKKGVIGTIVRNKEAVGGFIDWEIAVDRSVTRFAAGAFWVFRDLTDSPYTVTFYERIGDKLVVSQQIEAQVEIPGDIKPVLDKLIGRTVEFIPWGTA